MINKKLRVGYYQPNTKKNGGIIRYIKSITEINNDLGVDFVNFAGQNNFSIPILHHVLSILSLFIPYFKIHKKKVDVYWGPAHKLPLFRVKNVFYIVTIHDLVWKVCPQTMPLRRRLTESFFFPIALRNADTILAVSQSTASDLVKYFPACSKKLKVIPLAGMFTESQSAMPYSKCSQKYVLFVGTIEPRKNISNMLFAYAALPSIFKEKYKFYLVGNSGWGRIELDSMIVGLGLAQHVEWKSSVNHQELSELYQNAYCLLFPSFYEGFGLPILEAQNFGVPVITSDISSMPEVAGEGALLVDPNSVESIKNALESLLKNAGLRDALSQKAKDNVRRFSWEKTIKETCGAFSESMNLRGI